MYQDIIAAEAARMGVEVDPRHVEGWMRLEFGSLDAQPRERFRAFIRFTSIMPVSESESLAESYGL